MRRLVLAAAALAAAGGAVGVVSVYQGTGRHVFPQTIVGRGSNNTGCVRQPPTVHTLLCVRAITDQRAR